MIQKKIHLTWFSGEEYPEKIRKCLDTWKNILPDFEVKIWTLEMAKKLDIPFVNEALDARKWAFAGDVVRAYAVWSEGGIYMDTDIFLLKRFDQFLAYKMVFFMELNRKEWEYENPNGIVDEDGHCQMPDRYVKGRQIQAALFMGEQGCPALKEIIDYYSNLHFTNPDGSYNMTISPCIYAKILERYGFLYKDMEQNLNGNIKVFPSSFVAISWNGRKTDSFAIHLADHSWNPPSKWRKVKGAILNSRLYPLFKLLGVERIRKIYWKFF